jgi:transcription antitermination factor NusG
MQNIAENHLSELEPRWFALHTKFRSEKAAFRRLESKGIATYLPIKTVVKQYNRKKITQDMPLIHSFVFVKIRKSDYVSVLETEHVAGFLRLGRNLLSIPEQEIELMKRLLGEGIEVAAAVTHTLQKGDWVEIANGPLMGLTGRLVSIQGKEKVVVDLSLSGYSLLLNVETALLRRKMSNEMMPALV